MLQSPTWQSLREALPGIVGGLILAIPAYAKIWRDSKKAVIEDREMEARTALARASTESLTVRDGIATGEVVGKMLTTLLEAGETISEQAETIRKQSQQIFEKDQDLIELKLKRIEVEKLHGLIKYYKVPYSDADKPEIRSFIESLRDETTDKTDV
jgi:hypothetical protein